VEGLSAYNVRGITAKNSLASPSPGGNTRRLRSSTSGVCITTEVSQALPVIPLRHTRASISLLLWSRPNRPSGSVVLTNPAYVCVSRFLQSPTSGTVCWQPLVQILLQLAVIFPSAIPRRRRSDIGSLPPYDGSHRHLTSNPPSGSSSSSSSRNPRVASPDTWPALCLPLTNFPPHSSPNTNP